MRIWNLPVAELDNQHLLGEHFELHVMWSALTGAKRGWINHPETRRFRGRLGALYRRHEEQVAEMKARGMTGHKSPLEGDLIPPGDSWEWPPVSEEQLAKDRLDLVAHYPGLAQGAGEERRGPQPDPWQRRQRTIACLPLPIERRLVQWHGAFPFDLRSSGTKVWSALTRFS